MYQSHRRDRFSGGWSSSFLARVCVFTSRKPYAHTRASVVGPDPATRRFFSPPSCPDGSAESSSSGPVETVKIRHRYGRSFFFFCFRRLKTRRVPRLSKKPKTVRTYRTDPHSYWSRCVCWELCMDVDEYVDNTPLVSRLSGFGALFKKKNKACINFSCRETGSDKSNSSRLSVSGGPFVGFQPFL